jgi:hypothetical protein
MSSRLNDDNSAIVVVMQRLLLRSAVLWVPSTSPVLGAAASHATSAAISYPHLQLQGIAAEFEVSEGALVDFI